LTYVKGGFRGRVGYVKRVRKQGVKQASDLTQTDNLVKSTEDMHDGFRGDRKKSPKKPF